MKTLQPPIELERLENESKADYIRTISVEFSEERDYDDVCDWHFFNMYCTVYIIFYFSKMGISTSGG